MSQFALAPVESHATAFHAADIAALTTSVRLPVTVVRRASDGAVGLATSNSADDGVDVIASLAGQYPEWLGERSFAEAHGCRFPYVVGEMARGIATASMVIAAGEAGTLGFFGSAGLMPDTVEPSLDAIAASLDARNIAWGANLIHSPQEPELERAVTDLFLARGVRRVSASAFMRLNANVVRYACRGLTELPDGRIQRRNHLFAKVSRVEVARGFMQPPPAEIVGELERRGELSRAEASLASRLPLAGDVTAEADSGGHTDNRPLAVLLPTLARLRDALASTHGFTPGTAPRIGAAGGIGCPVSAAAAFTMGAAYVLTGTINQAACESGLSEAGRALLAEADMADVTMAPAADMFEMGVKLQVLQRGTMFAARANQLHAAFGAHDSIEALPTALRSRLEKDIFGMSMDDTWADTRAYFQERRPQEVTRAETDPRHRFALVCRWYLGHSSQWAMAGEPTRRMDYQVWCGPAMGAFNRWVKGSFLEPVQARTVGQIALNLLEGATVVTRASQLRSMGVPVPAQAWQFTPRPLQ